MKKIIFFSVCDQRTSYGIFKKTHGLANGFQKRGFKAKTICVHPKKKVTYFIRLFLLLFSSAKIIHFRVNVQRLLPIVFITKLLKMQRKYIIFDIPTPFINLIEEERINKSDGKNIKTLENYGRLTLETPDLNIFYSYEGKNFISDKVNYLLHSNGIDFDDFDSLDISEKASDNTTFVCVGAIAKWHGWDRLLKIFKEIIEIKNIHNFQLKIIGEGPERKNLEKITRLLGLEDKVEFLGFKNRSELLEIYSKSDVGIGSLGWSSTSVDYASPLKSREYLAAGLHVIYDTYDPDLTDCKYATRASSDEKLLESICNLTRNQNYPRKEIQKFAKDNLDYSVKVKEIIDKIEYK